MNYPLRPALDIEPISPVPGALADGLDSLRVAVTLFDTDQRLIYANRHYRFFFREFPSLAALLGRRYEDLVRLEIECGAISPKSCAVSVDAYIAQRCDQLSKGLLEPCDIHLNDGRIIELKVRRTDTGWVALWNDASAARHAYGRLETAVDLSADGFAFWDRNDRLVLCNDFFAQWHGYAGERELKGIGYHRLLTSLIEQKLIAAEDGDDFIARRLHAHHCGAGIQTVTLTTGAVYQVRERLTPDGGRATVLTDISERIRAEAALAQQSSPQADTQAQHNAQNAYLASMLKRLDQAEEAATQAKSTFLRTMGHELKTPLNAILGFSDMLRANPERFSPAQIGEYAALIHSAGGNLFTLLTMIMDLTKIAAGSYPITVQPVSGFALLAQAADGSLADADAKSIAITVEGDRDLMLNGDENACIGLLRQLIGNAVRFTQPGGHIVLTAGRSDGLAMLEVRDNGPGVAAEHLPKLTLPFEQAGRHSSGECSGAGLGLALADALAALQGGRLVLSSTLGEGFSAAVLLPLA